MIPQASAGGFAGSSSEHNTSGIDGNASYITIASPDKKDFSVVLLNNTQNEKKYSIKARDLDLTADSLNLWETATDSYMKYIRKRRTQRRRMGDHTRALQCAHSDNA